VFRRLPHWEVGGRSSEFFCETPLVSILGYYPERGIY